MFCDQEQGNSLNSFCLLDTKVTKGPFDLMHLSYRDSTPHNIHYSQHRICCLITHNREQTGNSEFRRVPPGAEYVQIQIIGNWKVNLQTLQSVPHNLKDCLVIMKKWAIMVRFWWHLARGPLICSCHRLYSLDNTLFSSPLLLSWKIYGFKTSTAPFCLFLTRYSRPQGLTLIHPPILKSPKSPP